MRDLREIEFAFLGCIFDNPPTRVAEAFKLKANVDWFSDQTCRLVWTAIDTLRKRIGFEKIKPLVIIQEAIRIANRHKSPFFGQKITPDFIDDAKRFRDAASADETTTIEAYAPLLQEAAIGRKLNEAMDAVRTEDKYSSNSVRMMELAKQIQQIQKDESPEACIDVAALLDQMTATYDKAYEEYTVKHNYSYVPGIPYPWDSVTHITEGLNPGLHIIAARPSVGKTSFVLQCINFWCDLGYKVAVNCLDMSVTEIIKRHVANLAYVSPKRMKFGWASPEEQFAVRQATERIREIGNAGLMTWTVEYDVDKLKSWAELRHRAGKLDILVVDFAQRFRLKGSTSEYDIATYVSGVLKQLANECLMPVILLSQLSRDNVKDPNGQREPELSDLRGSGALEQDATTVVLLHKEAKVISNWRDAPPMQYVVLTEDRRLMEDRKRSIAAVKWKLAKNQNGSTGELPFVVFQDCFRWYLGDPDGEDAEAYQKIMSDWRFLEDPFLTAERNNAVIYPKLWPQKCAEVCGNLGLEIPSHIRDQLQSLDIERYETRIKEYKERMTHAKNSVSQPIDEEYNPPSIMSMASTAATLEAETVKSTIRNEKADSKDEKVDVSADLDTRLNNQPRGDAATEVGSEPAMEFEDDDF